MITTVERLFVSGLMIVGVAFYSIVIGIISSFFSNKSTKASLLTRRIKQIDEYCENLGIGEDLADRLKMSVKYASDKMAYLWLDPNEDIFNELNINLKYQLLLAIHNDFIGACEFFKPVDVSFIVRIVPLLKPVFFKAGEIIWKVGDSSSFGSPY